ncbi:MAG: hypothetical protein R6U96_15265 [Promethearchaeia archaeon]
MEAENLVENHPEIENIGEGKIVASLLHYAFTKKMLMGDRETWLACGLKHHYEEGSYPIAFERLRPRLPGYTRSFYWKRLNEVPADNIEWGQYLWMKHSFADYYLEEREK